MTVGMKQVFRQMNLSIVNVIEMSFTLSLPSIIYDLSLIGIFIYDILVILVQLCTYTKDVIKIQLRKINFIVIVH